MDDIRDIAVAVTCYNNEDEVLEFAKHLSNQSLIDKIQLLVTCNACINFERFQVKLLSVLPTALAFNPGKNLGYLHGCLYGVKKSESNYAWVMISNTDIEFTDNDYFEKLLQSAADDNDIWCIGSDIVLKANGAHQNPFLSQRPSKRKFSLWKTVYSSYPLFRLYFKLYALKHKEEANADIKSSFIYATHGSCFLLKDECVNKIIEENPGIFMYGEELLVAEIIKENNKKCYLNIDTCVLHNENQVTGRIGNRKKQGWFKQSINYLFENHLS